MGLVHGDEGHPFQALDQQIDPGRGTRHLLDHGLGADGIEIIRRGLLGLEVRWATTTNVLSSLDRTASAAAIEMGRPTDSGKNR